MGKHSNYHPKQPRRGNWTWFWTASFFPLLQVCLLNCLLLPTSPGLPFELIFFKACKQPGAAQNWKSAKEKYSCDYVYNFQETTKQLTIKPPKPIFNTSESCSVRATIYDLVRYSNTSLLCHYWFVILSLCTVYTNTRHQLQCSLTTYLFTSMSIYFSVFSPLIYPLSEFHIC